VPHNVSLTIELKLTEPVSGVVTGSDRQPAGFTGWVELHTLLEGIYTAGRETEREPATRKSAGT
jgi:hypothetical protein